MLCDELKQTSTMSMSSQETTAEKIKKTFIYPRYGLEKNIPNSTTQIKWRLQVGQWTINKKNKRPPDQTPKNLKSEWYFQRHYMNNIEGYLEENETSMWMEQLAEYLRLILKIVIIKEIFQQLVKKWSRSCTCCVVRGESQQSWAIESTRSSWEIRSNGNNIIRTSSVEVGIAAVSAHVFHRFLCDLLSQVYATQLSLFLCIPCVFMANARTIEDALRTSLLASSTSVLSSNVGSPDVPSSDLEITDSRSSTWEENHRNLLTTATILAKRVQNRKLPPWAFPVNGHHYD